MFFLKLFLSWILPDRAKIIHNPYSTTGGAKKSPVDKRDLIASAEQGGIFPTRYTLPVGIEENQGLLNSCVAHMVTGCLEDYTRAVGWKRVFELSRMHCWNKGRQLTWGDDWTPNRGIFIRDGWKAAQTGITLEKLFPYQLININKEIHPSFIFAWYPSFKYYFIKYLTKDRKEEAIKQVLEWKETSVGFGIKIGSSFINASGLIVYEPPEDEIPRFNHAMRIIGWDDDKDAFKIKNSWGSHWGTNDCLWVKKDWLLSNAYDLSYPDKEDG